MWIQYTFVQYIENRITLVCGVSHTSQLWVIGLSVFFFFFSEIANLTRFYILNKYFGFMGSLLVESWLCIDWSRNFLPKKNLIQKILHCQHGNTSSVEILDLNVSCDSIPIRLKNNLMQFRFFCVLLVGKMWNPSIHVSLFTAVCTALYNCIISFFLSEYWCFCPAWGLGYSWWSFEQVWRWVKQSSLNVKVVLYSIS